jgi:Lon protease-like protein
MREIPLFPLNAVLFPGVPLHLHIFEDRYKIMVRHCMNHDGLLGVVLIHQGVEAMGPLPEPYKVGTLGRIVESETLQDGRANITVLGMDRFRILATTSTPQPYLVGVVEASPFESPNLLQVHRQSRVLARAVRQYLYGLYQAHMDTLDFSHFSPPDDPSSLVFLAAALLQIPPHEKQPILEAASIHGMMEIVERLYRRENGLMNALNNDNNVSARQAAWLN